MKTKPKVTRVERCSYCRTELQPGTRYGLCRKHGEMFDFFHFLLTPVGKTPSGLILPGAEKPDGKPITRFEHIIAEARVKSKL